MHSKAEELFNAGDLAACKKSLFNDIKKDPSNIELRIFLFQLFCVTQDWQKALNQLEVLRELSDSTLALVNTYQQLIACEAIRTSVLIGDKEPTCFGEPSQWMAYYVKAFHAQLGNDFLKAVSLMQEGAELAPEISGSIDGEHKFNWISDGDVRFGPAIEVFINGNYYWLPLEYIAEINFEPVEDIRDLVWRAANLTLKNKGQLIVFIPVRYPIDEQTTDAQLLSKTCEWHEPVDNFYLGQGQRILVTDEGEYPLLNINSITLNTE